MVGGTSWFSTVDYYKHLNKIANQHLGGTDYARLVLWSLNFGDIDRNNKAGRFDLSGELVVEGAQKVEAAGAEALLLCANTMHMYLELVRSSVKIPVISIMDAVAQECIQLGSKKPLLLGTKYTMEGQFYFDGLRKHGVEAVLPNATEQAEVHRTIFEEFVLDDFNDNSRQFYLDMIERCAREDCIDSVIMGCTEIPILLSGCSASVPLIDTTFVHSKAAVDFALS